MTATRDDDVLTGLEAIYRAIRGAPRRLWPQDRLVEDLRIDSLAGLELLVRVEDEFGVRLVDDPRSGMVSTVGELVALIAEVRRAGGGCSDGGTDSGAPA